MNILKLNPDEMAFRKIYKADIESEKLTVVFRPGNRDCRSFRGYCVGQIVCARVLNNVGADWASVEPTFIDGFFKKIEILKVEVKKISSLSTSDFIGSSVDIYNKQSLIYNLGIIYNLLVKDIMLDSYVTKISFRYIN